MTRAALENPEAEVAVLGAILRDREIFWAERGKLGAYLFADPLNRDVMKAIETLAEKDQDFAIPSLLGRIPERDDVHIGGYLGALKSDPTESHIARDLVGVLRECWHRREMLSLGENMMRWATDPGDMTSEERLDKAMKRATALGSEMGGSINPFAASLAIDRVIKRLDQPAATRKKQEGVPWFLPEIGRVMGGNIEFGWFVGLLSDSGGGKTSLALQQAYFAAKQFGIPTLFMTEQTEDDCYMQMASQLLQIESGDIRRRTLSAENKKHVRDVLSDFKALPLQFIEMDAPTVRQVGRWVQGFARHHGKPCFAVIDHEDILEANHPRDDFHERLRQIDRDLRSTMVRLRCACLYLMQRNAQAAGRENPRPTDRDLLGGPRRKKSFDAIIYLYREWLWLTQKIKSAPERSKKEQDMIAEMKLKADAVENRVEFGGMKARFGKYGLTTDDIRFDALHTRFWSEYEERNTGAPEMFE